MSHDDRTIYDDILEVSAAERWTPQYEFFTEEGTEHQALKMKNHYHPVSVKINEFNRIKQFVIDNGYTRGYELATAFGISALAAGLGFKETGGELVTMDAYIEESFNNAGAYIGHARKLNEMADGLKSVNTLIGHFGLTAHVYPVVGWSPDDVGEVILGVFGRIYHGRTDIMTNVYLPDEEKIDYVFIDALHTNEAFIKDLLAIEPFLAEHCGLLVHDSHMFGREAQDHIRRMFGKDWTVFEDCVRPLGWNLAYVTR